ncbi:MAG: hypothetical protein IJ962_00335 [Clostridia bacterium]|nr:hypothetical protein [Clostridia bacterium]
MKKIVSLLLVLVMAFTIVMPAAAIDLRQDGSTIPVITIYGDGEPLYDTEGNKIFHFRELVNQLMSSAKDSLGESLVNMLKPFFVDGIVNDEWDSFYAVLEQEMSRIFAKSRYSKDGENINGSDVHPDRRQTMADFASRDTEKLNGSYHARDYQFWYDWRQDPYKTADEFHAYIEAIKETTGKDKVSVLARCLGTSVLMAYIEKYGTDSLHGIAFNGSIAAGAEIVSEMISGKSDIDLTALSRMLADLSNDGTLGLDGFILATIDLLATAIAASGFDIEETAIHEKLAPGVFAAGTRATFFTWPGYWALVTPEDYEDALTGVFGPEGSKERQEYAKLIEKVEYYQMNVTRKIPELLKDAEKNGVKVGVIAKYGYQLAPVVESKDMVADQYVTVEKASFGATTTTIYDTFSDEYIAEKAKTGADKYISPDKHIDASTCLFPDSTWFTKGISHSTWTNLETALLFQVITADKQLTIDDFDCSQYIMYDKETGNGYAMTAENCNIEPWNTDKASSRPETIVEKFTAIAKALVNWLKEFLRFAGEKLGDAASK